MWYLAIFSLVMGLVGGYLIFRFSNHTAKQSRRLNTELNQTKEELIQYRAQVNKHFSKTAELVNALTADYRAMYGHLAEGAQQLCDGEAMKLEAMNPADAVLTVASEDVSVAAEETSAPEEALAEKTSEEETPEDKTVETSAEAKVGDESWREEDIPPAAQKPVESGVETRVH